MNSLQLIKILEESYSETNLLNCIDVISYLEEVIEEKKMMERFFHALSTKGGGKALYKEDGVLDALTDDRFNDGIRTFEAMSARG